MAIRTSFSKKEHVDSGLALLLLTLLLGIWIDPKVALQWAIGEVLIILTVPMILYPFTFLWLNISDLMGKIMSKVILTAVFIVMVCPVGLVRKALGKDTLLLKKFKSDDGSVFMDRNHKFTKTDFTTSF